MPADGNGKGSTSEAFASKRGRPTLRQAEAISRTILSAATELFLTNGFAHTTMDIVAMAAGVPKSTLYKRHKDKRALLQAVLDAKVLEWGERNSGLNWLLTDDLEQRLGQYCVWMIAWARTPEVHAFTALAATACVRTDEHDTWQDAIGYSAMTALIERDIREFGPRLGIEARNPALVAVVLMALVAGRLQFAGRGQGYGDSDDAAFVDLAISLLMRGSVAW